MSLTMELPGVETKGKKRKKTASKAKPKTHFRQRVIGVAFFALAVAVLSVSLPHLAQGMHATLGVGWFAASALAVLFDLSQIAAEAFLLTVAKDGKERWTAKGVILGATAVSVAYNGMAFLSHAETGFGIATAFTLAVALPVGVLALSYLGSRTMFAK
jgi:hypothetical protein